MVWRISEPADRWSGKEMREGWDAENTWKKPREGTQPVLQETACVSRLGRLIGRLALALMVCVRDELLTRKPHMRASLRL